MEIEWLAVEKLVAGMIQALTAGLIVLPMARVVMGPTELSGEHILLFMLLSLMVALLASSFGLLLGCSVPQGQIGLMFSLVVAPMIFFGCTYYPWQALAPFTILRWVVLINPLVYASEGFRSALVPAFPHLPSVLIVAGLVFFNGLFITLGLQRFRAKALT
jgi:ABC-2 type transport system permease protein